MKERVDLIDLGVDGTVIGSVRSRVLECELYLSDSGEGPLAKSFKDWTDF